MFNFKKIGTAALSLAALSLVFQGSAFAAGSTELSGSGTGVGPTGDETATFTPGDGQEDLWNKDTSPPTADGKFEISYNITSSDSVVNLNKYEIVMTIPTTVSFAIDTHSADSDGVVKIDSNASQKTVPPLGTVINASYGTYGDDNSEVKVDSIVSVVGYDIKDESENQLNGGFNFSVLGEEIDGKRVEVELVKAVPNTIDPEVTGPFVNQYLGNIAPVQLAVVPGALNADPQADEDKGSEFDLHYKVELNLGDPDAPGTISNQLRTAPGNIVKESGKLTLRYGFRVDVNGLVPDEPTP